jgi:hypothetical protein
MTNTRENARQLRPIHPNARTLPFDFIDYDTDNKANALAIQDAVFGNVNDASINTAQDGRIHARLKGIQQALVSGFGDGIVSNYSNQDVPLFAGSEVIVPVVDTLKNPWVGTLSDLNAGGGVSGVPFQLQASTDGANWITVGVTIYDLNGNVDSYDQISYNAGGIYWFKATFPYYKIVSTVDDPQTQNVQFWSADRPSFNPDSIEIVNQLAGVNSRLDSSNNLFNIQAGNQIAAVGSSSPINLFSSQQGAKYLILNITSTTPNIKFQVENITLPSNPVTLPIYDASNPSVGQYIGYYAQRYIVPFSNDGGISTQVLSVRNLGTANINFGYNVVAGSQIGGQTGFVGLASSGSNHYVESSTIAASVAGGTLTALPRSLWNKRPTRISLSVNRTGVITNAEDLSIDANYLFADFQDPVAANIAATEKMTTLVFAPNQIRASITIPGDSAFCQALTGLAITRNNTASTLRFRYTVEY